MSGSSEIGGDVARREQGPPRTEVHHRHLTTLARPSAATAKVAVEPRRLPVDDGGLHGDRGHYGVEEPGR